MAVCAGHSTTSVAGTVEGFLIGQRREAMGAADVSRMVQELNPGIAINTSARGVTELPDGNRVTWPADPDWKPEWAPSSMLIDVPATVQRFPALEGAFKDMALRGAGPMVHEVAGLAYGSYRNDLRHNVILSGGATLLPGYVEALEAALSLQNQETRMVLDRQSIRVIAPPERAVTDWIGSSIYGSLNHWQPMLKGEWDEGGPSAVHRLSGYRKSQFQDLHEENFRHYELELECRPIPPEITPLAMQAATFSKHHYSFDPLWSQQVPSPKGLTPTLTGILNRC